MSCPAIKPSFLISRRVLLQSLLIAPLATLFVACGREQPSEPLPSVALDTFPTGLGRGFPLATLVGADNSATGISPGDIAPDFRLQLNDDQGLYLSDLVGRPVMVNFWATWCGPCRLEMPEIVRHADNTPDLVVIAMNVQETQEPIAAFASDFNMTMPIVRDQDAEIRDLYQVPGMPTTVFIDRAGEISTYRKGVLSPSMLKEYLALIV